VVLTSGQTLAPLRNPEAPAEKRKTYAGWLGLFLVILFVSYVRIRLLDFPLERDEGEFAYYAQLLLQMIPPFGGVYTMKLPGTALCYAAIMGLLGQTTTAIHLGLWLVNGLAILLLFVLVKKLLSPRVALIAAASFAVLSLGPGVNGFAAHATQFVVLFALAGTLVLLQGLERRTWPWFLGSGLLFGLSFLMKQPAVFFGGFGLSVILLEEYRARPRHLKSAISRVSLFGTGALFPLAVIVAVASRFEGFDKFWFWTFRYPLIYATQVPLAEAPKQFLSRFALVSANFVWLWGLAGAGLLALCLDQRLKGKRSFITLFLLFSCLSVLPGFHFWPHYFVTCLSAVAILIALAVDYARVFLVRRLKWSFWGYLPAAAFLLILVLGVYGERNFFFLERPETLSRVFYEANPFIESIKISEFLKARTSKADKIAVIGSEPQIYFYTQRLAATGYIYTYMMMESQPDNLAMQKEMAAEIEKAGPKYLIVVNVGYSWAPGEHSPRFIFDWLAGYREHYVPVGIAEIVSFDETRYYWLQEAQDHRVESPNSVVIYERKDE
jgi:hypothetical protein